MGMNIMYECSAGKIALEDHSLQARAGALITIRECREHLLVEHLLDLPHFF
jgi:hypothetical protein